MTPYGIVAGLCVLLASPASLAHGDWPPKHGGIMNEGGETSFELVQRKDGIHFYVEDHGDIVNTGGSIATLSVVGAKQTRTFRGTPGERNKLVFPGASVRPGDKLMLKV